MYTWFVKADLKKDMEKFKKKKKVLHEAILKQILKVAKDPNYGEPLKYDLAGLRSAHVCGNFVLLYKWDLATNTIHFLCLKDHKEAYKCRPIEED
jgi:mRNA-degrading endonuclease RelE of RelBE toxin-antitoxin system